MSKRDHVDNEKREHKIRYEITGGREDIKNRTCSQRRKENMKKDRRYKKKQGT